MMVGYELPTGWRLLLSIIAAHIPLILSLLSLHICCLKFSLFFSCSIFVTRFVLAGPDDFIFFISLSTLRQ